MSPDAQRIVDDLERMKLFLRMDVDRLGEQLAEANAAAILQYMIAETDPDGNRWDPLSDRYAEWKAEHFPGQLMSHLYGVMRTSEEVYGTVVVQEYSTHQKYGVTEEAEQEAVWFQEGNDNQPARRFYDINELGGRLIADVLDGRFDEYVGT